MKVLIRIEILKVGRGTAILLAKINLLKASDKDSITNTKERRKKNRTKALCILYI